MYYDYKRRWLSVIHKIKPQSLIEIGTAKAMTAQGLVTCALDHHDIVHYIGYDLFDLVTEETNKRELNKKGTGTYDKPFNRLQNLANRHPGFTFKLVRGFTTDTLTAPIIADFVYIDGGHSYDTVKHDYSMVRGCRHVMFDDYHLEPVKKFVDELFEKISRIYNFVHVEPNKILLDKF